MITKAIILSKLMMYMIDEKTIEEAKNRLIQDYDISAIYIFEPYA